MRKLLAIALLALLGLPFAPTLFALTLRSDSSLPACCRRNGKHDCMGLAGRATVLNDKDAFTPPPDKCPFAPTHAIPQPGRTLVGVIPGSAIFAGLESHPAVCPQTLANWRISRERTNQRRGPPAA